MDLFSPGFKEKMAVFSRAIFQVAFFGAIFLCWEAFPFNSHSTLTVIEIAF